MRRFDLDMIKELLQEAEPTFTDRKLYEMKIEKVVLAINNHLEAQRLRNKLRWQERKLKKQEAVE